MADDGGVPDGLRYATAHPTWTRAIRRHAPWLFIAGLVCLYFGLSLIPTAPGAAQGAEVERWRAIDRACFLVLRIIGGAFLLTAGLMLCGLRVALLVGVLVEGAFAALVAVMSVLWTLRARADGHWDISVILLVVFFLMALLNARDMLGEYRASRPNSGGGAPPA
ncbi:MAG: hypothetical protein IPM18_16280 [Phycisphaerales bacterium]|nr:hypothetical protein [Phycisphaerales bacterium]